MSVARMSGSDKSRPRTGEEIRSAFLAFFAERGHQVIPSASLIPDDPTVLLTIAGMLPFKPIFLGQEDRPAPRVTSSQKCIRTNDIENVGRTARHHTFFEMLGNFSFGDYFKEQAIQWAWELSTEVFQLNPRNLVVSVFREDEESAQIWKDVVGVNPKRIIRMDEADNFWASGPTGPCGPCSELYYDFTPELGDQTIDLEDDSRFIEFYNLVFMQYNRDAEGQLTSLESRNIDTGMGLERMAQILQEVPNNYETDLIYPLVKQAATLAGIDYFKVDKNMQTSLKVIGDHSRAVTQLICDGVTSSNLGRGYVLRRLIRRVVRHGRLLGIAGPFLSQMGEAAIDLMKLAYPDLLARRDLILHELHREEVRFLETLERGEKLLEDLLDSEQKEINGFQAFELYDTYGFPIELTQEIAQERGLRVDKKGFDKAMEKQRQRAKAAAVSIDLTLQDTIDQIVSDVKETCFYGYEKLEGSGVVQALIVNGENKKKAHIGDNVEVILDRTPFYGEGGGQVGDHGFLIADGVKVVIRGVIRSRGVFIHSGWVEQGTLLVGSSVNSFVDSVNRRHAQANHTATHLLQSALKQLVDPLISQAGSLVDFERLRFDFNCTRAVTSDELEKLEDLINGWILEAHPLQIEEMSLQKAKDVGAIAMFGEKYSDLVRVVHVPGVSMELCGGTHVVNTAEIGFFKIVTENGIAAGIRRIEAVAGLAAFDYLKERDALVKQLSTRFKVQPSEIVERVIALQEEVKDLKKMLGSARDELALSKALALADQAILVGDIQVLVQRLDGLNGNDLQLAAQGLAEKFGETVVVVLGGLPDIQDQKKVILVAAFGSVAVSKGFHAGKFIGVIARHCGGGGGGRPHLAQAGGRDGSKLDDALQIAVKNFKTALL